MSTNRIIIKLNKRLPLYNIPANIAAGHKINKLHCNGLVFIGTSCRELKDNITGVVVDHSNAG